MKVPNAVSRRMLVKSSVVGLMIALLPNSIYAKSITSITHGNNLFNEGRHDRYPAIQLEIASEVVGVSHFDFARLKQLVDPRPELAKAKWDWGFGDWESAIDAASHVGRKDIVTYLISKGAMPTIFTYAMLGEYETVKTMGVLFREYKKTSDPTAFNFQTLNLSQTATLNSRSASFKLVFRSVLGFLFPMISAQLTLYSPAGKFLV
jgi:hypothetical protein